MSSEWESIPGASPVDTSHLKGSTICVRRDVSIAENLDHSVQEVTANSKGG